MTFKTKQDFINLISHQFSVTLANNECYLNNKRNVLYTQIDKKYSNSILSYLKNSGITYESHIKDNYFIYIK